jgi:hypothetical protein
MIMYMLHRGTYGRPLLSIDGLPASLSVSSDESGSTSPCLAMLRVGRLITYR